LIESEATITICRFSAILKEAKDPEIVNQKDALQVGLLAQVNTGKETSKMFQEISCSPIKRALVLFRV